MPARRTNTGFGPAIAAFVSHTLQSCLRPVAMLGATTLPEMKNVTLTKNAYDCARGADAVAIVTEWNEFRNLNLARLKRLLRRPVLCDLRNIYVPAEVEAAGFRHIGVGRGRVPTAATVRPRRRKK